MALINQIKDWCSQFELLAQPEVEHLLNTPGDFAQIAQANHAAGALERVEGAAEVGQYFGVVRVGAQGVQVGADGFKHFLGLFDEDGQKFGV